MTRKWAKKYINILLYLFLFGEYKGMKQENIELCLLYDKGNIKDNKLPMYIPLRKLEDLDEE